MEQHKNSIAGGIKSWMDNEMDMEKMDSLKRQLNSSSIGALDEVIAPMWDSFDEDAINERSNHLLRQSQQKEKIIKLNARYRRWQIAAILIPAIMAVGFVTTYFGTQSKPNYFELQAMKGEKSFLILPDHSKVWINSDTYIKYSSDFNVKERCLHLNGEGFFDVAHHSGLPFTVFVGKISIVVKGTKFNVRSSSEEIEVALLQGKVDILQGNDQLLASLKPNQVISINAHDPTQFTIRDENVDRYGIWIQNKLIIQNENIVDISKKIEKWYGVNIKIVNAKSDQKYTFAIKTESLNETLNLLNQLMIIDYSVNGEEVIIKQN